jgi:scyllo-inositol 2-dehydrogenase (NADP+)
MHNALLITGGDIASHNYAQATEILTSALSSTGKIKVTATHDAVAMKNLSNYDVVIIFTDGDFFDDAAIDSLVRFVHSGKGLVTLHTAAATNKSSDALGRLIGSRITAGKVTEHHAIIVDAQHPITHRVQNFRINDEIHVLEPLGEYRTLAAAYLEGKKQPLLYVKNDGAGRVVHMAHGHSLQGLKNPGWQQLFTRSVRFAAGEDWSGKTIKCAALGYGGAFNMGKAHLESCKKNLMLPTAVCDLDPARTATAKAELGEHIVAYNDVSKMLNESDAEMVIVITPHNTHAALSRQVLESNRHVVTEKPYTITVEEATTVIELALQKQKMATVFHNRRWDGHFKALKKVVDSGAIGEVFQIECQSGGFGEPKPDWWRASKAISGGSIYDWGAHFTDWILQIMPWKIQAITGAYHKLRWFSNDNEDHTVAGIRFEGGRTATLEMSSVAAIGKPSWRVLGTHGAIELKSIWNKDDGLNVVSHINGYEHKGRVPFMQDDWDGFYRNIADHLLVGEPLAVTPESARDVIAVLSLSEVSSKQGGIPVVLPYAQ